MVPIKHLSNFWRTLEMTLINCEINLILTWSANCFIINALVENQVPAFTISDTKLYVPLVTLLTQDNAKLLQQFKSGFKRTSHWNKYQSKITAQERNRYFDYSNDPSFQRANKLFVLSFENNAFRKSYKRYYLLQVEIRGYNIFIDRRNFFDQQAKNNFRTYDNIRKMATSQGDDYTAGSLLDYLYFKNNYKMIAIGLSEQQDLDADPKATQQINFTRNLDRSWNTAMFFIIEEAKETILDFSQETVKVL